MKAALKYLLVPITTAMLACALLPAMAAAAPDLAGGSADLVSPESSLAPQSHNYRDYELRVLYNDAGYGDTLMDNLHTFRMPAVPKPADFTVTAGHYVEGANGGADEWIQDWSSADGNPSSGWQFKFMKLDDTDGYVTFVGDEFGPGNYLVCATGPAGVGVTDAVMDYTVCFLVYAEKDLHFSQVTLSYTSAILGPGVKAPEVSVRFYGTNDNVGTELVENQDYKVEFRDNDNNLLFADESSRTITKAASNCRAYVTALDGSGYCGSAQWGLFSVVDNSKVIPWCDIALSSADEYLAAERVFTDASKIDISVSFSTSSPCPHTENLVEGEDYSWHFETLDGERLSTPPTQEGSYLVVVEGAGYLTGKRTACFTLVGSKEDVVGKKHIAEVEHGMSTRWYNGLAKEYVPTSMYNVWYLDGDGQEIHLEEGTDYRVHYYDNVNAGRGMLVIEGIGDYCGVDSSPIVILSPLLTDLTVTIADQTYTGSAIVPSATVESSGIAIPASDYAVSAINNVNAGVATATVSAQTANVEGSTTKNFTINPANLTTATVNLSATSFDYNGAVQRPTVTSVTVNGVALPASDYNVSVPASTAAGTYTVEVTPETGNVTGKATATYRINPSNSGNSGSTDSKVDLSKAKVTLSSVSFTYNGKTRKPTVKSVKVGGKTVPASDYKVTTVASKNVGTYYVIVAAKGANTTGSVKAKYTIGRAANTLKVKAVKTTQMAQQGVKTVIAAKKAFKVTKNTSKGKVSYKMTKGPKGVTVSSGGVVTVKANVNAGTYTVKVTGTSKATANYKAASATVSFKVKVG